MAHAFGMDHRNLIEELGTREMIAAALGVTSNSVSHWKARGIPPFYWPSFVKLSQEKGKAVELEHLRAGRSMKRHPSKLNLRCNTATSPNPKIETTVLSNS